MKFPVINEMTNPPSLRSSMRWFYDNVVGNDSTSHPWADVRDVAEGHRLALEREEAGSERILIGDPYFTRQVFSGYQRTSSEAKSCTHISEVDAANALQPVPKLSKPLPKGNPGSRYPAPHKYDITKSQRIPRVRPMGDILSDFAAVYGATARGRRRYLFATGKQVSGKLC
ncbi:hypothetical protein EDD16DRAFT_1627610 [Pisolithus croceorrhizus]|nr:hypothetical protein EDD16DRAFT_1627610 [Pisolithus croceorrhizus]KAI6124594.1 hypothetical protein EV401DRAFT_1941463 [Pisolithus croceorrhizus]